jgi:hypothetical protein
MSEHLSTAILSELTGVTVTKKIAKGEHKPKHFKVIEEEILKDLDSIKSLAEYYFVIGYYIVWKWAHKQPMYASHLNDVFSTVMLHKTKVRDVSPYPFSVEVAEALLSCKHPASIKGYITILKYLYKIYENDLPAMKLLDKHYRLKVIT